MKQQRVKFGAGSLINQIKGNNATEPKVGEWCTILGYTDRDVAKVVKVSPDGNTVVIQKFQAKADPSKNNDMGHQNWIFESTQRFLTLVWKYGAWRKKVETVVYTDELQEKINASGIGSFAYLKSIGKFEEVCGSEEAETFNIVKGFTKVKTEYPKISILFNSCDYYYDWEF